MDLRASTTTGFWPAISAISLTAKSTAFGLSFVSRPIPLFRTIFSTLGTCIAFV